MSVVDIDCGVFQIQVQAQSMSSHAASQLPQCPTNNISEHEQDKENTAPISFTTEQPTFAYKPASTGEAAPILVECSIKPAASTPLGAYFKRSDQRICDILASCRCMPYVRGLFQTPTEPGMSLYAIVLNREAVAKHKEYHLAISKIVEETYGEDVSVRYYCQ